MPSQLEIMSLPQTPQIDDDIESQNDLDNQLIPASEAEHLIDALSTLSTNINRDDITTEINAIIEKIHDNDDSINIDTSIKETIGKLIHGNPTQALMAGTSAFFIGFAAGIASSSTIAQTSLTEGSKTLLTGIGAISGGLGRLKLGIEVNKNGGSRLTSQLLLASLVGLVLTAVISETTDLNAISNLASPSSIGLGVGALLSGFGISTFAQVSNVINWHQEAGYPSAFLGGVAGLAPGIVGLMRFGLLQIFGETLGYQLTSALLIASLSATTAMLTYSQKYSLVNSPCHQLMNDSGLSFTQACLLSDKWGQTLRPSENLKGDWQALVTQLHSPKVLILIANYIFAFGGFLGMTASLNLALSSWGYSAKQALLTTSLFSLWSSFCRALIASPINFLEKDLLGGGVVNSIGSMLVLTGALALAIPNKVPESQILLPMLTVLATGFGISCAATFKCVSSEIHKEKETLPKTQMVAAKTNALVSCTGTLGSVIYTIGGGQLAEKNSNQPELGYVQIFYAIAALSVIGGAPVLFMSYLDKALLKTQHTRINDENETVSKKDKRRQTNFFFEDKDALPPASISTVIETRSTHCI